MAGLADAVTLSIELDEDELLGAHLLATMEGIADDDSAGFADVLRFTLQRGIVERLAGAGIQWPPKADAFDLAESVGREVGGTDEADTDHDAAKRSLRRTVAIAAIAIAAIVAMIGGYGYHWSWTGFPKNHQVWDWLHLLLLPIAFGTLPLWLRYAEHISPARRRVLGAVVVAFFGFVAVGYLAPVPWSGFRGQTLWNWLTLIVLPISVITLRAWPETGRSLRGRHVAFAMLLGLALAVTIIGGYGGSWAWTGYKGNTLWDWLALLLGPIVVGVYVAPALVKVVSGGARERSTEHRKREKREKALRTARERADPPA